MSGNHAKMVPSENPEDDLMKLTPKQRLYLDNRVQGMSVKMAASAAGYNADSSRVYKDLEKHPRIASLLTSATKSAFNDIVITRGEVLQGFMDAVTAAQSSTELVMAWREIGKVIGAYSPEVKINITADITAEKVRNMDDEALLEMAEMETFKLPEIPEDVIDVEFEDLGTETEAPELSTKAQDD